MTATATRNVRRAKPRFSFAAIYALVGRPTANEFASTVGVSRRTIERWKATGIPHDQADDVAVAYELHPINVWPEQW